MAVRIQNGGTINFGTLGAAATITHFRLRIGAANFAVQTVDTNRVIANGGQAQFSAGAIDVVLPSNDLTNAGHQAFVNLALNGTNAILVDAMTSASAVVSVTGYSQQSVTDWDTSTEND